MRDAGAGPEGRGGPLAHAPERGLPGGGSGSAGLPGAMAAGGPSRSERKAAERVRRLREEQQRERLRQVRRRPPRAAPPARAALTARPAPAGVAHPEEGGGRAQRRGGPAPGRERGPGDRAAGSEQAARGPEAAAGGGESRGAPGARSVRGSGRGQPGPGPGPGRAGAGRASRPASAVPAGVRRPGGAAEESPGAGRRRAERQVPGGLHRRGHQHGKAAGRARAGPGRGGAPPSGWRARRRAGSSECPADRGKVASRAALTRCLQAAARFPEWPP